MVFETSLCHKPLRLPLTPYLPYIYYLTLDYCKSPKFPFVEVDPLKVAMDYWRSRWTTLRITAQNQRIQRFRIELPSKIELRKNPVKLKNLDTVISLLIEHSISLVIV